MKKKLHFSTCCVLLFIYALILLAGGFFGYISKQSFASLIAGSTFGILFLITAIWFSCTQNLRAIYLALFLSFLIDGFFTYRFLKTGLFFPAGIICLLTLGIIYMLVAQLKQLLKNRNCS